MQPEPHAPPGTVSPHGLWRLVRTLWLVGLIAALAVGLVLPFLITPHGTELSPIAPWVWLLASMFELAVILFFKRQSRVRIRQSAPKSIDELITVIALNWLVIVVMPLTPVAFAAIIFWMSGDRTWHSIFTGFALAGFFLAWPTLEQYRDVLPWMPLS
jgi:hypothetical protein